MSWPRRVEGLAFGGDYNPEQWPVEVQEEDVRLMQEAGVTLVSVAIFSWAMIEPAEGRFTWDWLDATMDRLEAGGVRVALATATASPPPWLTARHPEILPRLADGTVLGPGARQAYAVTHPVWRRYAVGMARRIAERYRDHPALALWHVDNEIGAHAPHDFSDAAADAFRAWLEARYGTVEELNRAWGTAFWSQRYATFADVRPPRVAPASLNPTQQLDFARFSSDALLGYLTELCDTVRAVTPDVPVTTNFMIGQHKALDYFGWADRVDVVATDHYPISADPERHVELAFAADLTRGIAGGRPWMLMEHSTSAVSWHPRNRAKHPGEMLRASLAHVARGADAVMFFQWRQAVAGAEKFHSAMVPHAGTDSDVWRDVVRLGDAVRRLAPVRGSLVEAEVAIAFDYQAWWACELDSHPSVDVTYLDRVRAYHRELWLRGVTADVVHPSADLSRYRVVLVPTLYLVTDDDAANLAAAARAGASVVVSYFSGIVDEDDHVRLGGYPGAFRDLLGVRVEEFHPLLEGETLPLDDGTRVSVWTEKLRLAGASAVRTLAGGVLAGTPAVTRHGVGAGAAWYEAARLDAEGVRRLLGAVLEEAGVSPGLSPAPGVEVVSRRGPDGEFRFVLNHTDRAASVPGSGLELLTGRVCAGDLEVPPGGVAVLAVGAGAGAGGGAGAGAGARAGSERRIAFPLITERLLIRPMEPGDARELFAVYRDAETMQHLTSDLPEDLEAARELVRRKVELYEADGQLSLWTVVLRESGRIVGDVGLQHEDYGHGPEVGIGGRGNREFWHLGLGLEAAAATIDAGFGQLGLERIVAETAPGNLPAQRLLRRLGMRPAGTNPQGWPVYVITREDWAARASSP